MNNEHNKPIQSTRYIPVPNWERYHDWPKVGGLRNLIFFKHQNGFDKVVKKVGKRVLIDEAAFFEWVANQGQGGCNNEK